MVDEDVALADDLEHVGALAVLALQARLGHRRPRRGAQLAEAGQLHDLPQVVEVEQALDLVDLALLDLERRRPASARSSWLIPASTSSAHDLAEAPPAQLGLDGLEQVVGLVGDLEVGVAGDAEDAVVDDLHAREQARRGWRR